MQLADDPAFVVANLGLNVRDLFLKPAFVPLAFLALANVCPPKRITARDPSAERRDHDPEGLAVDWVH